MLCDWLCAYIVQKAPDDMGAGLLGCVRGAWIQSIMAIPHI